MSQDDLFADTSSTRTLNVYQQIVKDKATLKRLNMFIKRIESRIELNEHKILFEHKQNGTFIDGEFVVTIEAKMPQCRPKWKDEFEALARSCKLDASAYVAKVVAKVAAGLVAGRAVTVRKVRG